jgi:hypothetical protein
MLGTPQYMQSQFQTGNEPKSAGYQWATRPDVNADTGSGMGVKQFNQNIQNWASSNPTANTAAINAYADKYGLNAQDIYNATNNRWGNTLQVPKYGTGNVGPVTPLPLVCGTGMKPNADGTACVPITTGGGGGLVCGVGMTPNAAGTACVPITTTGLVCGEFMKPNAAGTACIPNTVEELKCEAGFQPNAAGTACVPIPDDTLKCEAGFQPNADGTACVPIPDDTLKCGVGFQPNADGTACVPIPDDTLKCEAGFQPNADGTACVPIPDDTLKCGAGMMPNADGTACIPIPDDTLKCGAGMMPNADGTACIPIPDDTLKCGVGMTPNAAGTACIPIVDDTLTCGAGMTLNAAGTACIPIIDTPAACGAGMVRNAEGVCVPIVADTLTCGVGMTPNAAGTACVPIGDTTTTTGLTCGVGMKPNAEGTACVADSTLTTLSTIIGGNNNDVIQDDGTTASILSTIAGLNGTSTVTGAKGNDVIQDDGTTESILNTIAALNGTTGTTGTVGTTGNTTAADDGTTDSILNTISTLNGLTGDSSATSGTTGNNAVTGATSVNSTTGLDTTGNGAGTGLNTDLDSITDLGNGLYSVNNGDGTFNIITEDGTSMGSVGGGAESVQDWEGNRVLTGIPNVLVQAPDDTALHYYPEGAEQIERYNNWLNSLKGGDAGASAFMGNTGDIANRYDDGFSAFSGGGGGGGLGKYMDDFSSAAYAKGGHVKTHYNDGGPASMPMGNNKYSPLQLSRLIAEDTALVNGTAPFMPKDGGRSAALAATRLNQDSNLGQYATAGYGDLGQFAGSFDPANVPMGDNRYSPADQYRMIARDASIVNSIADGSATIRPRDGGRASMANLMGDSDAGRFAVAGYGDLGQFAGSFKDDNPYNTDAFAHGGRVKTHFQTGGANQTTDIDQMAENYGVSQQPDMMSYQGSKLFPMQGQAPAPVSNQMTRRDAYPPTPQSPMDARSAQLDALLQRYAGDSTDYSSELAEARKTANTESMAFQKMIQEAMKGSADAAPSKAEMYFRLASAFGSPTKTGHFAESLGNVNKELAAYSKEERDAKKAQRALQLQMGLEGQKMRMSSAKDDLTTLRTLASEEMKSKRAITAEVIKDFIKSGEPESAAGKQAKDEGLKVGTPEFQTRVNEIAQTSVDAKLAQVTATLAGMSVQQANLALAQSKFQNQQAQQAKLSPAEMKLKTEVEDILTSTDQAMLDLKRAYQLNPNTFDTSLADVAQRKVLEQAGVKDPKVIATREQTNLLSKSAVGKLKTAFGGNPTEGERKILLDLEGIDSKSKEERAIIMKNSYSALKMRREREQKRLNEISQGLYRNTSAPTGELE